MTPTIRPPDPTGSATARRRAHTTAEKRRAATHSVESTTPTAAKHRARPDTDASHRAETTTEITAGTTPTPPEPTASATVVDDLGAAPVVTAASAPARSHVTLRTALDSLLGRDGSPEAPVATPALWVLAAAARRQLGAADDGDRATATLTSLAPGQISATPVVNAPDAAGVVTGSVLVTGADAETVVYAAATPGKGNVVLTATGTGFTFTYTPSAAARHAASAIGADAAAKADSVVFTISDGTGSLVTVPVAVAILPADAPPIARGRASLPSFTGDVRGRIIARDADRDPLVYTALPTAKGGTVQIDANGRFVYTPTDAARHAAAAADATDADKSDTFDVVVSDGHGGVTTVTVSVRVKPGNADPTATVRTRYSPFTPVVTGTVRARDLEKDALTFTADPLSAKGGTVTIDDRGRFVYTPTAQARHDAAATDAPRRDTVDAFGVVVSDDHGGTTTVNVIVRIKPANVAPAGASTTDLFTNPNTGVVDGRVVAVDADGDTLTYGIVSGGRKGSLGLDDETGMFSYAPSLAAREAATRPFAGPRAKTDAFTVSVDDGHGGTTLLTVRVAIAPLGGANQAPTNGTFVASAPGVFTGTVTGSASATDPDRDALTYSGSGVTAKGSVVVDADGSFTYKPSDSARHQAASDTATAADTQDTFTVTAADGFGGTLDIAVTVAVGPAANKAPTRGMFTATTDESTGVVTGTASATDADSDVLTFRGTGLTEKGDVIVESGGGFVYRPTDAARTAAGTPGAPRRDKIDTFDITVDDGHGGTLTIPVRVAIVGSVAPTIAL